MTHQASLDISLDHIALAVSDIDDSLDKLRSKLGATIISGDEVPGYRFAMARVGDAESGMNLEVLEPRQTDADDFLERFLRNRGEGPHHITFLQNDVHRTLDTLEGRGYRLVRTKLDFGPWQESFIHPSHGCGTVVQVAGSTVPVPPMADLLAAAHAGEEPPAVPFDQRGQNRFWWARRHPPAGPRTQAVLERVVVNIPDLGLVRDLFLDVFQGEAVSEDSSSIEVTWGKTGRIIFTQKSEASVEALELSRLEEEFELGNTRFRRLQESDGSCTTG